MHLWFAINVEEHYSKMRERVRGIERVIPYENTNLSLPYHISLKITFKVADEIKDAVIKDVEAFFRTLHSFEVQTKGIECDNIICWVRYLENDYLVWIAKELNRFLHEKYGIPYHPYDLDFKFHTTLFMDEDTDKVRRSYELVKGEPIPKTIKATRFIVGYSDSGQIGTYKVMKEIAVE